MQTLNFVREIMVLHIVQAREHIILDKVLVLLNYNKTMRGLLISPDYLNKFLVWIHISNSGHLKDRIITLYMLKVWQ